MNEDVAAAARTIIDSNRYMTLATADERGVPWASPVWFAPAGYRELFWVSAPEARHSRNLAARPQAGIVIFDSSVPVGEAQAVYMSAVAEQLTGSEVEEGLAIFNRRGEEQGLRAWTNADVGLHARHRLYRATATEQFVLGPGDERIRVSV
jgi:pyridoxine/pyridoxamine 5'-phosphate oxidase